MYTLSCVLLDPRVPDENASFFCQYLEHKLMQLGTYSLNESGDYNIQCCPGSPFMCALIKMEARFQRRAQLLWESFYFSFAHSHMFYFINIH